MKKYLLFFALLIVLIEACRQKSEEKQEDFLPALQFIQNDVADVDTSLYPIIKITWIDTAMADTVFVKREEFRGLAANFLQIPDLAEKEYKKRFTEEKFYDQSLNTVIFTYQPMDAEKEEIQRQEILITPHSSGDKVRSIIIDQLITNKDSSVMKRMLWQVNKSFQVTTTIQKSNIPEKNFTMKVVWNEPTNY
jgi:hypothetical protein